MNSISVVKENTGILSREALEGTGYGLLCRAFALQILSRMSVTDGLYRQLALEFAEEPEPAAPAGNEYRISLELILETLRKLEPSEGTERIRTERLLERVETRLRERTSAAEQARPAPAEPRPTAVTVQNLLFRTILQLSEEKKPLAFPQKTLSGAFLRAESAAARAASAEAATRARSASAKQTASGQKRRTSGDLSASDVLAFKQSGAPTEPSSTTRTNSRNKAELESLRISAASAAQPTDAETVFPMGKPEPGGLRISAPDAETVFVSEKSEPANGLSPTQIAQAVDRTLERRLREETAQLPHARRAGRQEAAAEQKRREPTAVSDQSAATEPFQKPKVSRLQTEEQSKTENSRPEPTSSSGAKPEQKKSEHDRGAKTVGAEADGDFHSLSADSGRNPGGPIPQKHGFSPVNQDIRTATLDKPGLAEHPEQLSGEPKPGKSLPRSPEIPQTQELLDNSSSRAIYARETEELTLREFHTPEPDARKTGLSKRDSSERLRQSAQQIFEGSESDGSAGKAAKPPISEHTAAAPAAPPISMAVASPSAAGETSAPAKPFAQNQAPTAERQASGRESRFSAALQTHGLSPVNRDIRTAAPAEKPGPAEYPRQIFGAADPAADMVYSPEALLNVHKTDAESADMPGTHVGEADRQKFELRKFHETEPDSRVTHGWSAGMPEPAQPDPKSKSSGRKAFGALTPVSAAIHFPNAAEVRSVSASLQMPAAELEFPTAVAEPRSPEMQGAERQSPGLRSRTEEHSGHSRTAPTVNRDIRTAVRARERLNPKESPLPTFGVSERTKFSPQSLTAGEISAENAGLREKRETAHVGQKPWEFRTPESGVLELQTPASPKGSQTNSPDNPGLPGLRQLAGKIKNMPALNHSAEGATAPSISGAEASAAAAGTASASAKPFEPEPPRAADPTFSRQTELKSVEPQPTMPRSTMPRSTETQGLTLPLYGEAAFPELVPFHPAEQSGKAPDSVSAALPAMADLSTRHAAETAHSRRRGSVEAERMGSAPTHAHTASHAAASKAPQTMESAYLEKFGPPHAAMPVSRDIRTAGRLAGIIPRGGAESAGASYADAGAPALEYAAAVSIRQELTEAPAPQMDSEYIKSLPAWAQNFLKNGSAENSDAGSAFSTAARDISVLPDSGAETGQMRWTTPQRWSAPQRRPAELSLRQKEEPQTTRPQEKLSDTEIRHMADKVYKLIEDRIRRERRRMDL